MPKAFGFLVVWGDAMDDVPHVISQFFLDGQLWDITVTIRKEMKWQEHPLVSVHA